MTYRRLFYLKYKRGISTFELAQRYPEEIQRVSQIALLDIPDETLREVIEEKSDYHRLIRLKKRLAKYL